jgi:hypothetical protein
VWELTVEDMSTVPCKASEGPGRSEGESAQRIVKTCEDLTRNNSSKQGTRSQLKDKHTNRHHNEEDSIQLLGTSTATVTN